MLARLVMLPTILAFAACSLGEGSAARAPDTGGETTSATDRHPISNLRVIDLAVLRGDQRLSFRVELADTPEAQARGLMYRTEMGDDEGMLFPSAAPEPRSFWMKNTPLSLDIIFVGTDGRILNIAANTLPYSLESVSSQGYASAVLELRAGRAAQLGIVPGDTVEYVLP